MDKVIEPSSSLNQNSESQNSNTIRLNNNWKRGFFVIIFLWTLSVFSLIYINNSKKIAIQPTKNINSSPTPILVDANSITFKPTLISTKEYKNKTIGIFSFNNKDAENMFLYRNYLIAIVKDKNPYINVIPGYINTSLAVGHNVQSCENCYDIVDNKIVVIDGETNSVNLYEGEFYDDGRNYFTNLSSIVLPYDSKEIGNLSSIKCQGFMCGLKSRYKSVLSCSLDINIDSKIFSNASCTSINGKFTPNKR